MALPDTQAASTAGPHGRLAQDETALAAAPAEPASAQAPTSRGDFEDERTPAFARATHALNISVVTLLSERGVISETDALGVVDRARGFAATDAGAFTSWQVADAVLVDAGRALAAQLAEMRARPA